MIQDLETEVSLNRVTDERGRTLLYTTTSLNVDEAAMLARNAIATGSYGPGRAQAPLLMCSDMNERPEARDGLAMALFEREAELAAYESRIMTNFN